MASHIVDEGGDKVEQRSSDNATPTQPARVVKLKGSSESEPSLDVVALGRELRHNLAKAQTCPVYITLTWKHPNGHLNHWQGTQRGFPNDDILPTLLHLAEDAKKNMIPKDMTGKLRQQLADRKKKQ